MDPWSIIGFVFTVVGYAVGLAILLVLAPLFLVLVACAVFLGWLTNSWDLYELLSPGQLEPVLWLGAISWVVLFAWFFGRSLLKGAYRTTRAVHGVFSVSPGLGGVAGLDRDTRRTQAETDYLRANDDLAESAIRREKERAKAETAEAWKQKYDL